MENDEEIRKAVKLFIGVQLIVENGEAVASSSLTSIENKRLVKNLTVKCKKLEKKFWTYMDDLEIKKFNNIVKSIEDQI